MIKEAQKFSDLIQKLRAPTVLQRTQVCSNKVDENGQMIEDCYYTQSKMEYAWEVLMDKVYQNAVENGFDEQDVEVWVYGATD